MICIVCQLAREIFTLQKYLLIAVNCMLFGWLLITIFLHGVPMEERNSQLITMLS